MARTWKHSRLQPIPNAPPAPTLPSSSSPSNPNVDKPILQQLLGHRPNTSHRRVPLPVSAPMPSVATGAVTCKPASNRKRTLKRIHRIASPTPQAEQTRRHNITHALRISSDPPSEHGQDYLLRTPLHVYQVELACLERLKKDLLAAVMADVEQRIMLPALCRIKFPRVTAALTNQHVHMFVEYACGCLDEEAQSSMSCVLRDVATANIRQVTEQCAYHGLEH